MKFVSLMYVCSYCRLAISFSPVGIMVFSFYNFYRKHNFTRPQVDILKNMRFLQMFMGLTSDGVALLYEFIEDFIYWK